MPDGSRVAVKIADDQEFIEISGGGCSLSMDSGVVDVLSIGELAPGTFLPGSLHECGSALSYNAPFVTTPTSKGMRVNPGKGSTGQISGTITKNAQFKGRIGESLSFKPAMVPAVPATDPPTQVLSTDDGSLWAKKLSGVLCPPSIFTGKTRLYVQAMYGLPLYQTEQNGSITTNAPLTVESSTSAAPALWLPAYIGKDDFTIVDGVKVFASYPDILLDTSCGVWLDPDTGNHWLFKPAVDGNVRVYPLKSNACGEKLRKYLVYPDNPLLPELEDREHLEAYILAYSRPDAKNMQIGGDIGGASNFSMGYGWHWNWTGDRADIVVNESFMQDESNAAMRSTHYFMIHKKIPLPIPVGGFQPGDMRQAWEVTVQVAEGPSEWSVYRTYWTITEPNYDTMILNKVTSQHSIVAESNAPFYAFYNRNDLRVCRVEVTYTEPEDARIVENDCFGDNGVTTGMTEGDRTEYGAVGGYYSCRVTVGSEQTPLIPFGYVEPFSNRTRVYDKVLSGYGPGFGRNGQYATYACPASDDYGNSATTLYLTGFLEIDRAGGHISFKTEVSSGQEEHWGLITVVVPFYDAEAAYLHYTVRDDTINEASTTYSLSNSSSGPVGAFLVKNAVSIEGDVSNIQGVTYAQSWGAFAADYHDLNSTDSTLIPNVLRTTSADSFLTAGAGKVAATFTHLNEFHSNALEEVGAEFATLTSTQGDIAIAPGYIEPVGLNGSSPGVPVIVGWV